LRKNALYKSTYTTTTTTTTTTTREPCENG